MAWEKEYGVISQFILGVLVLRSKFLYYPPDWDIPKHLARFEFNDLAAGGLEVKVFPYDLKSHLHKERKNHKLVFGSTKSAEACRGVIF